MTVGAESMVGFLERFQNLQKLSSDYEKLIQDLLLRLDRNEGLQVEKENLLAGLRICKLDLEDATESRRELQQRLQKCNLELDWIKREYDALKNKNSYVMVAIDGDGLIFRHNWIKLGLEGGRQAAEALRATIAEHCGPGADQVEIVIKVAADLGGLARTLVCEGNLESPSMLREFAAGFSQAYPTCDFVDVGSDPGAASTKVKETTRWHLQHESCKHVLLGIAHDGGYAPFLYDMLQDDNLRPCMTVIEGPPVAQELIDTQVNTMRVGDVLFRTDKPSSKAASSSPSPSKQFLDDDARTTSPSPSVASSSPAATGMSYANVTSNGSSSPPTMILMPLAPKSSRSSRVQYQQIPPKQLDWNPGPRGLDEPITVSTQALENIKKRKDNEKLCNNHFLRGPCTKGDTCLFAHDYKPSADEISAIAVLARQNPCTTGQYCESDDCIYGHHCPSIKEGVCGHPFCKYPDSAHPPGTKFKKLNIRAN